MLTAVRRLRRLPPRSVPGHPQTDFMLLLLSFVQGRRRCQCGRRARLFGFRGAATGWAAEIRCKGPTAGQRIPLAWVTIWQVFDN